MTAAIHRSSTPSLSVPQTQNTAPVLEFACLYTHDLRKKAKKWLDGVLRYHTFNKRAMVYDVPRNFIGDMHWTGGEDMQEGDEVLLEKAGVKVEVAERIGETETDLSELRVKKTVGPPDGGLKRRVERGGMMVGSPVVRGSSGSGAARGGNTQQLKHKSLNALLGTPKGQMGKATLPTKSPFEERHAADVENQEWEDGRPAKKAKVTEGRSTKASKQDAVPLWTRTADRRVDQQQQQPATASKVYIDLSDDVTPSKDFLLGFSSDALAPSSPVRDASRDVSGRSSSPASQTRHVPAVANAPAVKEKSGSLRVQELDLGRSNEAYVPAPRLSNPRTSLELARQPSPRPSRPSSVKPGQTLRLAASAPKKRMLLCQDQLTKRAEVMPANNSKTADEDIEDVVETKPRPRTANERVQERLRLIAQRKARSGDTGEESITRSGPTAEALGGGERREEHRDVRKGTAKKTASRPSNGPIESHQSLEDGNLPLSEDFGGQSSHETSAIELARLDRMMLPPAAPRRAPTPPVSVPSPREVRPLRRVISEPPNKPSDTILTNTAAKTSSKRIPDAPVRYTPTPSPVKRSREQQSIPAVPPAAAEKGSRAPSTNFKPKKNPLQKSVSLNLTAAGTSSVILGRPFHAPGESAKVQTTEEALPPPPSPSPRDVGPWSREAFDLFKWRPPGWDEEKWCVVVDDEMMEKGEEAGKRGSVPGGLSGGASLPAVLKGKGKGV